MRDTAILGRKRADAMRWRWLGVLGVAVTFGFVVAPTSALRPSHRGRLAPITGTLSKQGYSVIALAYTGRLTVSKPGRSFKLTPPGSPVTLQLRGPNGKYAGPVVIGHKGKWLIVGVKAGAHLGTVKIRSGYATISRKLHAASLDSSRVCQQHHGVPLGNGLNFGYVRSSMKGKPGLGNDPDLSCVPGIFNVASNGKRILNAEYRAGRSGSEVLGPLDQASAAQAATTSGQCLPGPQASAECAPNTSAFYIFSQLFENLQYSVNVDAGSSYNDVDSYLQNYMTTQAAPGPMLQFEVVPGGTPYLDCGGLSYCSAGGTGHEFSAPRSGISPIGSNVFIGPAFPSCCGPNASGWGQIMSTIGPGTFSLFPLAPVAQIGTGDVYLQHVVSSTGVQTDYTSNLEFIFETTPALDTLSDGAGDSYTVRYPPQPGDPGVYDMGHGNPFQVAATPGGDIDLTLHLWRPQRPGIPGVDPTPLMDMGHLNYGVMLYQDTASGQGQQIVCPDAQIVDSAADASPNPANTLTLPLDVTSCLSAQGVTPHSGDIYNLDLVASDQYSDTSTVQFAIQFK